MVWCAVSPLKPLSRGISRLSARLLVLAQGVVAGVGGAGVVVAVEGGQTGPLPPMAVDWARRGRGCGPPRPCRRHFGWSFRAR